MKEKEVAEIIKIARLTGTDPVKVIRLMQEGGTPIIDESKPLSPLDVPSEINSWFLQDDKAESGLPKEGNVTLRDLREDQQIELRKEIFMLLSGKKEYTSLEISAKIKNKIGIVISPKTIGNTLRSSSKECKLLERKYGKIRRFRNRYSIPEPKIRKEDKVVKAKQSTRKKKKSFPGENMRSFIKDDLEQCSRLLFEEFKGKSKNRKVYFREVKKMVEDMLGKKVQGQSLAIFLRNPRDVFMQFTNHQLRPANKNVKHYALFPVSEGI
jgi:hypothetical protein